MRSIITHDDSIKTVQDNGRNDNETMTNDEGEKNDKELDNDDRNG